MLLERNFFFVDFLLWGTPLWLDVNKKHWSMTLNTSTVLSFSIIKTILDMTPVVSLLGIVLRSSFLFSLPTTHDDVVFAVSQN